VKSSPPFLKPEEMPSPIEAYARRYLGPLLEADELTGLIRRFEEVDVRLSQELVQLGLLVSDISTRSAAEYFRQLPSLLSQVPAGRFAPWVGLGMRVVQKSGAAGVRFFKESPALLLSGSGSGRGESLLASLQRVAEADPALVLESFRAGTELLDSSVSVEDWLDRGLSLCAREYTLAVEYFRATPRLLRFISVAELPRWVETGLRLAEGTRYFDTLVFFRLGGELFQQVPEAARSKLLSLVWRIAQDEPAEALSLFKEAPDLLLRVQRENPTGELADAALETAFQVAAYDAGLAAALFRRTPEIAGILGARSHRYLDWISEGLSLLGHSPERAKGYFSLATREGRAALDRLMGGVSLQSIELILVRIATAMGGRPLAIRPLPAAQGEDRICPLAKTDGWGVWLPSHLRVFSSDGDNFLWYKVAVAHAAGRVEFGSYSLSQMQLESVRAWVSTEAFKVDAEGLQGLFDAFPQPLLIRDLFDLSEGARVDVLLRRNYPGLARDLDRIATVSLERRLPIVGKSPQEALMELLFQISLAGRTREPIPESLQSALFETCRILGVVQEPGATVESSLRAACRAYKVLDTMTGADFAPAGPMERFEALGKGAQGPGEGEGEYRPADRFAHQGRIDPESEQRTRRFLDKKAEDFLRALKEKGIELSALEASRSVENAYRSGEIDPESIEDLQRGEPWISKELDRIQTKEAVAASPETHIFVYPEWDGSFEGYREGWCRLREEPADVTSSEAEPFVQRVRQERRGEISEIVRLFQGLRPRGFWKSKGEEEGEEIDLDALISEVVERRAGRSPRTRIYTRRNRSARSVAVAVLVDLSGSTARQLGTGRSVLEVEKEGLVLLSEALAAIGDPAAMYGFSGEGKDRVQCTRIKDFEEAWDGVLPRIGALHSSQQNRDGAAVRHVTGKLSRRPEKTKLLILISDGRPLDRDYEGSYALQDTRRALQEAKARRIHPFCITVDRQGAEYLEGMYGEVAYTVIEDVSSLPRRLPILYRKLTT